MAKRHGNYRRERCARVCAHIDREINDARIAEQIKAGTGLAVDAAAAQQALEDQRDPFEIARAASAALRGA